MYIFLHELNLLIKIKIAVHAISLQLNLFYYVLIIFLCIYLSSREALIAVSILCFITYVYPPIGWLRPHRHSDNPSNRQGSLHYD